MSAMFQNCSKLYDLSLSFLNINNAVNLFGIFHGCQRNFIGKNGKIFKDYSYKMLTKFIPEYNQEIM